MKTAKAKLIYTEIEDKVLLELFLIRTSEETYEMGNTSFLINYKGVKNPILTYASELYSGDNYEELECKDMIKRIIGIQIRTKGINTEVPNKEHKVFSVTLDRVDKDFTLSWRSQDTEIVTPQFQKVETEYTIEKAVVTITPTRGPIAVAKTLEQLIAEHNEMAATYPKFIYQGIILQGNYNVFPSPYTPMQKIGPNYCLFTSKAGLPYVYFSPNGTNSWNSILADYKYGCVLYDKELNKFWVAYHKWYGQDCYFRFQSSSNGTQYTDIYEYPVKHGEDVNILKKSNGEFLLYGRVNAPVGSKPPVRTVGFMKTTPNPNNGGKHDLTKWTPMVEVLKPDAEDNGKEFYSMSGIETELGYFAILNVFNPKNDKVHMQLVWSQNGEDNWERLNNRNPIVPLGDREQMYGCLSLIEGEVFLTTISAKFNHEGTNQGNKFFYTELYKIPLIELKKFL